eukprot:scaffold9738_cov38-Cyclotella_meneghiniana.AAC.7
MSPCRWLMLVFYGGVRSRRWCAPHKRVAGKCQGFSVARAGAAATPAIRSGDERNGRVVIEE